MSLFLANCGVGKPASGPVTSPTVWTLNHPTGATPNDSKNDTTGAVKFNAAFWWLTSAYSASQTFGQKRTLTITPANNTNQHGLWGIDFDTTNALHNTVDFTWSKKVGENYKVRENGTVVYDSGSTAQQDMQIEVSTGGVVKYYRNGSLVYTSANTVSANWYWKAAGGFYVFDATFTSGSASNQAELNASTITVG